jgi:oligopeptide/dipeptide ABC transporter ATP-binding protein
MYLGRLVEVGPRRAVFGFASHPYTRALVGALPSGSPMKRTTRRILTGELPSPLSPPSGCPFHPRCAHARDICRESVPALRAAGDDHQAACHRLGEIDA